MAQVKTMTRAQAIAARIADLKDAKAQNLAQIKHNLQTINKLRLENASLRADNRDLTARMEAARAERQLALAEHRKEREAQAEERKAKALTRDKASIEKAQATIMRILAKHGKKPALTLAA